MGINKLKIITYNTCSLVNIIRKTELEALLKSNQIDIALIQESHLLPKHSLHFQHYNIFRDDSNIGIVIIVSQKLKVSRASVNTIKLTFPCLFINLAVFFEGQLKELLIGSIYVPCNSTTSSIIFNLDALANLSEKCFGSIVGGDYNIRHISWGDSVSNLNGSVFYNWFHSADHNLLRICDKFPSYPSSASFLDHFLISSNLINTINTNFSISSQHSFSDHIPLCLFIDFAPLRFLFPNSSSTYFRLKPIGTDFLTTSRQP